MEMPARPKMTVTCKKEFIAHTIFIYKKRTIICRYKVVFMASGSVSGP